MVLFTSWFSSDRNKENEQCLKENLSNPWIEKVVLLCDDKRPFPTHEKIVGVEINHRPTFDDFFSEMGKHQTDFYLLANADIYFDDTLYYAKFLKDKGVFALCKWNDKIDGGCEFYNHQDSQDAWIFREAPVKVVMPFHMGCLGCDNRLVVELEKVGYSVSNPSLTIKAHHVHFGPRKASIDTRIPEPYKWIPPSRIHPFMSIVTRHYYRRPKMFEVCRKSVLAQKDPDFDHIIIKDMVGVGFARTNGYFYEHRDLVHGQYVFMLDDDNILITDDFVSDMKKIARENDNPGLIFVKMWINDCYYPTNVDWKASKLTINHIDTACVVVRHDLWNAHIKNFLQRKAGDFFFIESVYNSKPTVFWQDKFYTRTMKVSHGKPEEEEDLKLGECG